jgi:hypothetical protein
MTDPASPMAADTLEIIRLAALPPLQYDRERKPVAERMGVRVDVLDTQVARVRTKAQFDDPDPDRPPEYSDEALALRFTERHKDLLRYVAAWGRWLIWDGTVCAAECARGAPARPRSHHFLG